MNKGISGPINEHHPLNSILFLGEYKTKKVMRTEIWRLVITF